MSTLFLKGIEQAFKGGIDVTSDDFRLAFMATTYDPNPETDEFFGDVSSNVATGTTPRDLDDVSFTIQGSNLRVVFNSDPVTEANVTADTDKFVIYKWTGNNATSVLLACMDVTGGTLSPINGDLTLNPSANGWFGIKANDA
jgi:hypothetical protein